MRRSVGSFLNSWYIDVSFTEMRLIMFCMLQVESVVLKRFGRDAYRIYRLLTKAGCLLETDKVIKFWTNKHVLRFIAGNPKWIIDLFWFPICNNLYDWNYEWTLLLYNVIKLYMQLGIISLLYFLSKYLKSQVHMILYIEENQSKDYLSLNLGQQVVNHHEWLSEYMSCFTQSLV